MCVIKEEYFVCIFNTMQQKDSTFEFECCRLFVSRKQHTHTHTVYIHTYTVRIVSIHLNRKIEIQKKSQPDNPIQTLWSWSDARNSIVFSSQASSSALKYKINGCLGKKWSLTRSCTRDKTLTVLTQWTNERVASLIDLWWELILNV